jgi:hypothetical protein
MKTSKITAATLFICLLTIGCSTLKTPLETIVEYPDKLIFADRGFYVEGYGLTIICGGDSLFLDQEIIETDKAIANDISVLRCLHDAIFVGDQNAIDMMVFILSKKNSKTAKNVILSKPKFRGKELFSILLKLGNEFGCPPSDNEGLNINSYWSSKYMDMVQNFNGIDRGEFFGFEFARNNIFDNYTDENCGEYISRASYQILTESWKSGIVNLKDFGEE